MFIMLISDIIVFCLKTCKRFLKLTAKSTPGYQLLRGLLRAAGYAIGKDVYIGEDLIIIDELEPRSPIFIGNRVSIAEHVTLVISSGPNYSRYLI